MAELGPYPMEVRGIADELGELLRGPYKSAAFKVLSSLGEEGLTKMSDADLQKALKLLSQTPSQRDKTLAKLNDSAAATLIMRARYLGLCSERTLSFSERFNYVRGMSYRRAAEYGARAGISATLTPSMSEVLPGWGQNYDADDIDDVDYRWRPSIGGFVP